MNLFGKKEKIILNSEQQKEDYIQKLENAHVKYDIKTDKDSVSSGHTTYIVSINAADLKKIV